jgi:ATP-binding cassette subfamily F protein 3
MRHALTEALQGFEGALVLVSHDRHLLRVTSDTLLLVDAGAVGTFDGDLDDYPAWLAGRDASSGAASQGANPHQTGTPEAIDGLDRKQQRRQAAQARQSLQPLRQQEKALERRLDALAARRALIEQALSDPELYAVEAKGQLLALLEEQRQVSAELEATESAWLDVNEAIEQAR